MRVPLDAPPRLRREGHALPCRAQEAVPRAEARAADASQFAYQLHGRTRSDLLRVVPVALSERFLCARETTRRVVCACGVIFELDGPLKNIRLHGLRATDVAPCAYMPD